MPSPSPSPVPVVLLGATGTAGHATAHALKDAGHDVLAFGRRDPGINGITAQIGDVGDVAALTNAMRGHGAQAVVSCLASRTGTPAEAWAIDHRANAAVLAAAQAAGLQQMVLLSAICVQKPRLAFQHAKLAFEAELIASGLRYSIVRPTAFFKSLAGQIARVQAGKPYLLFGDGRLTACKPISDCDLGCYITACLHDPALQNRVLPIGGPGPALTPRDMGEYLFEATGKPPRFRHVPLRFIGGIGTVLDALGRISPRLATKAELARIGQYYASESMLLWDDLHQRYDADATPEFGQDRLFDYYDALIGGRATLTRGDHAVF